MNRHTADNTSWAGDPFEANTPALMAEIKRRLLIMLAEREATHPDAILKAADLIRVNSFYEAAS